MGSSVSFVQHVSWVLLELNVYPFPWQNEQKPVQMMYTKSTFQMTYIGEIFTRILVLPYVNKELNMIIMLPDEDIDLKTVTDAKPQGRRGIWVLLERASQFPGRFRKPVLVVLGVDARVDACMPTSPEPRATPGLASLLFSTSSASPTARLSWTAWVSLSPHRALCNTTDLIVSLHLSSPRWKRKLHTRNS